MYTILTREHCLYCDKAKALLREHNISTVTYNLGSRSSQWILCLIRLAGMSTVPQIFNEKGEHIGGYSDLVNSLGLDPTYH